MQQVFNGLVPHTASQWTPAACTTCQSVFYWFLLTAVSSLCLLLSAFRLWGGLNQLCAVLQPHRSGHWLSLYICRCVCLFCVCVCVGVSQSVASGVVMRCWRALAETAAAMLRPTARQSFTVEVSGGNTHRTAWKHTRSCRETNFIHILYKLLISSIRHDAANLFLILRAF